MSTHLTEKLITGLEGLLEKVSFHVPVNDWIHRYTDIPQLLKWAHIPRGAKLLEVGCGVGRITRHLAQRLHCKGAVGIDTDVRLIAKAESLCEGETKTIFQVADVTKLPFDDNTFDAVIELDLLHHVPNWHKAIREIHRVLKKGGVFLMKDYTIETFSVHALGLVIQRVFDHPYDHMFDRVELLTYLRKNGLRIENQSITPLSVHLVAVKDS